MKDRKTRRRVVPLRFSAVSSICLLFPLVVFAGTTIDLRAWDDLRFLEGLRQRRLFSLAEKVCQDLLAGPLTTAQQSQLTVELIRVHSEHAVNSPPEDRDKPWAQARETAQAFQRDHRDHPRLIFVRVQDALTVLAQGELARLESEVGSNPQAALQNARDTIREAVRLLESVDEDLTRMVPLQRRTRPTEGAATPEELVSLHNNVQFQMARAFRNRALCYPEQSADHTAALTQAIEQLAKPLQQIAADDPLVWEIRIDQITCLRLLRNFADAQQRLDTIRSSSLPDELVLKAAAEDVRLHIAAGNPQAGLDGLAQRRTAKPGQYADLDFAILEATASLWQQAEAANEKTKAEQFQKKSLELVQFIELHHGPYWGRRAELFLLGRVGKTASQDNLELLRRTADEFVRKEQLAEALLAYDRAAEMARQAQDADSAFQLAYKAALVQQRRGRIDDTIERLADLAARAPTHAQADQAHLLAVWLSAAEARKNPNQLDRYAELLSRHTHTWPDRATSDQARMWLGQLGESQSRWSDAVAAYRGVSKSTEHFEIAVERVAHSWKQWLAQLSRDNQPCEETARDAAEFLAKLCSDAMGNVPAELNATQRFAAITAAEILLQYTTDGYATAEQILSRALQHAATAPSQWTASANLLLVLALVGQPSKRDQAIDRLKSVGAGDPQELLRTLGKVAQLAEQAQAAQQQQLAAVQLEIARLLEPKRSALAPQQQLQLDVVRAKAHAAAGQRDAAVRLFEQIVAAQPDNGEFQERYAQLLLDAAEAASLNKALERWRIIARRSPPQSERWYAAKYSIALAQFKLGDKQGAAKLIRYLEATSGLGDEKTAKTFQELLSRCD